MTERTKPYPRYAWLFVSAVVLTVVICFALMPFKESSGIPKILFILANQRGPFQILSIVLGLWTLMCAAAAFLGSDFRNQTARRIMIRAVFTMLSGVAGAIIAYRGFNARAESIRDLGVPEDRVGQLARGVSVDLFVTGIALGLPGLILGYRLKNRSETDVTSNQSPERDTPKARPSG